MRGTTPDYFAATLGPRERWSTLGAVVLGIGGFSVAGVVAAARSGEPLWLFLSLPIALLMMAILPFAPTGYRLTGDGVHVERRVGPKRIPYRTIRSVDRMMRPVSGLSVSGSRGMFGRFGSFWNARLGLYRLFLTNSSGVVWLQTTDGWVGLSPDRPDEFVETLSRRLRR